MSEHHHPRIAIIGAGLAGLTLARVLQTRNIPFHIYERDASPTARKTQGGSLDMKLESGQAALKIAGLHEEFKKLMRLEGQAMNIVDKTGFVFLGNVGREPGEEEAEGPTDEYNPEIDRKQLRGIFLDALGDQVRWDHRITSIQTDATTHQRTLTFASGSSETYDLLIGADGANSHTRRSIPTATPYASYTGVVFIETYIEDIVNTHPAQNKIVGPGTVMAISDGKGIFGQQNGDGTLRVYIVLRGVPQDFYTTCGIPWDKPDEAKEKLLREYFADWSDDFRSLIQCGNGVFRPWPIYALPVEHSWTHERGITLIGDAAHVMSPFAGEGANVSMLDGALLGEAISDSMNDGDIEGAVERFEKDMFERAAEKAKESAVNLKGFMGTREEIEQWVEGFKAMMAAGPPEGY